MVVDSLASPVVRPCQSVAQRAGEAQHSPDLLHSPDVGVASVKEREESDGGEGGGSGESDVVCEKRVNSELIASGQPRLTVRIGVGEDSDADGTNDDAELDP